METNIHFRSYLAQFFLDWKMFQTKAVEKLKTHSMFNNFYFENCAVYEIVWKNVQKGTPQMTIRLIRIAFWIPKAPNTHGLCNTHWFSTAKMVTWTHLSVTLHVRCLSCCITHMTRYKNFHILNKLYLSLHKQGCTK